MILAVGLMQVHLVRGASAADGSAYQKVWKLSVEAEFGW